MLCTNQIVDEKILDLRLKIQQITLELNGLINPVQNIPELINSTNILRSNEHLKKLSKKQTELLSIYNQYSDTLEKMLSEVLSIQNDLTNILKDQSNLLHSSLNKKSLSSPKKQKKTKTRKK